MVEARIRCLPDYIEAQQSFPERQDSLDFLTHNLFDGAEWLDDDEITGAEDESALTAPRKSGNWTDLRLY